MNLIHSNLYLDCTSENIKLFGPDEIVVSMTTCSWRKFFIHYELIQTSLKHKPLINVFQEVYS